MGHSRSRVLVAVVGALLGVDMPLRAADVGLFSESGPAIVVRTYVQPNLGGDARTARHTAAAILQRAGIRVDWVACDRPGMTESSSACSRPLRSNELVVRVLPTGMGDRPSDKDSLGFAFVDLDAGGGSLATVYADRIQVLAERAGVSADDLMGKAMAHEIGHLLLGTNRHATQGLMRASWTGADLRRNRPIEWLFDGKEAEVMRRGVVSRIEPSLP